MTAPTLQLKMWMGDGHAVDLDHPVGLTRHRVARTLAHINRFGGNIPEESPWQFYSVAKHAVLVSHLVEAFGGTPEQQLLGLSHDDHESLIGDITTPVKRWLGADLAAKDAKIFKACIAMMVEQTQADVRLDADSVHRVEQADRMALILEGALLTMDISRFEEAAQAIRGLRPPSLRTLQSWGLFHEKEGDAPFKAVMQSDMDGYLLRGRHLCETLGLESACYQSSTAPRSFACRNASQNAPAQPATDALFEPS